MDRGKITTLLIDGPREKAGSGFLPCWRTSVWHEVCRIARYYGISQGLLVEMGGR